ncbi:S41 family peptidase [Paenibacillus sp. GCM10012306]|uniref:S41 family peptidase n=1 Tax=Paenibacillus sp. GCM10012306 TaxID=3317342 RepID=UPI0036231512
MKSFIKWVIFIVMTALTLVGCSRGGNFTSNRATVPATTKNMQTLTSATSPHSAISLTMKEKLEDFEYMWTIMEENYPFFEVNKRLHGKDWLADKDKYRSQIEATATDEEFYKEMNITLMQLNNGHTGLLDRAFYNQLFSIYTSPQIYGSGPWAEVLKQPKVLSRYGQSPAAEQQRSNEQGDSVNNATDQSGANGCGTGNIKKLMIQENEAAYLGIRSFDTKFMKCDATEIRNFLTQVKDYDSLIIDIRGNGGGNSSYWSNYIVPLLIQEPITYNTYYLYRGGTFADEFLNARGILSLEPIANIENEHLPALPPEATTLFKSYTKETNVFEPVNPVGFKGDIYLLVDNFVFSASEGFAAFAKGTDFATIIGGRTGGDGLGIDPLLVALPNSGFVFRFSFQMGLSSDGSCNEEVKTTPDVEVDPDTSKPLLKQPAIKKALELAASS